MPPKTPRKLRGEIPTTPKTGLRNLTSPPISSRLRSRLRKNEKPIEEPPSPSKESRTPLPKDRLASIEIEPETPVEGQTGDFSESKAKTQPVNRVSGVVDTFADAPKTATRPRGRLSRKGKEQLEMAHEMGNMDSSEQINAASQSEEPKQTTPSTPQLTSPPLVNRLRSRARKTEPRPTIAEPLSVKTPATKKRGRRAATMETPAPIIQTPEETLPKRNLIGDLVQSQEESDEDKEDEISIVATLGDSRSMPLDVKSPFKPGTPEAKPSIQSVKTKQSPLSKDELNSPLKLKSDIGMEDDIMIQKSISSVLVKGESDSTQSTPKSTRKVDTTSTTLTSLEETVTETTQGEATSLEFTQISVTHEHDVQTLTKSDQDVTEAITTEPSSPQSVSKQTTSKSDNSDIDRNQQGENHRIFEKVNSKSEELTEESVPMDSEHPPVQNAPISEDDEFGQPSESENSDSDDDAPEAISMSSGKSAALEAKRQEREAAQRLADQQKNKRREADAKLKQQKAAKKDRVSQQKLPAIEFEVEEEEAEPLEIPATLPLEMLEMVADMDEAKPTEKLVKHGKHTRIEDFEALEEAAHPSKKVKGEKDIGSIKVVSLANQARSKPVPESIVDFKAQHFYGDRVKRKNAVLNMSQKRKVAMKFRRS